MSFVIGGKAYELGRARQAATTHITFSSTCWLAGDAIASFGEVCSDHQLLSEFPLSIVITKCTQWKQRQRTLCMETSSGLHSYVMRKVSL